MKAAATSPARNPAANSPVNSRVDAEGEYQQLTSELFHDLGQPLSTLTCLLEVNLLTSRPAEESRRDLEIALKQIYSIVSLVRSIRELVEAGNADQDQQVWSLTGCLRDVVADLRLVAESANVKLSLISSSDCLVKIQASRLRQALFHLIEFALDSSAGGAEVELTTGEDGKVVRATIAISAIVASKVGETGPKARGTESTAESVERKQRELKRRLGLAIARRIIERADGSLRTEESGKGSRVEVRMPPATGSK